MRRSFRIGLRVGLLIGIAFALFKTVQARRDSRQEPSPEPWQPIVDRARAESRPPTDSRTAAAPVDEVGEPVQEPPRPEPGGVTPALRMPEVPATAEPASTDTPDDAPAPAPAHVASEVAMAAEAIIHPDPVAKPEPLDIVPGDPKPVAPVKKAAKAATAAKKATKKAVKKAADKVAKKAAKTAKKARAVPPSGDEASAAEDAPAARFVEPVGGVCPQTHPVKAKLTSKRFHLPGMLAYERTSPDRCYLDAESAEADGFNRSRR